MKSDVVHMTYSSNELGIPMESQLICYSTKMSSLWDPNGMNCKFLGIVYGIPMGLVEHRVDIV